MPRHRSAPPPGSGDTPTRRGVLIGAVAVAGTTAAVLLERGHSSHRSADAGLTVHGPDDAFVATAQASPEPEPSSATRPDAVQRRDAPPARIGRPPELGTADQPAAPPVPSAPRAAAEQPPTNGFADQDSSYAGAPSSSSPAPSVAPGTSLTGPGEASRRATPVASMLVSTPELHLLRRATFGFSDADLAGVQSLGIDRWLDRQLKPAALPDPVGDKAWATFPLAGATALRARTLPDAEKFQAMTETAYATLGRQIFSSRQLYEVVVDVLANHLNVPMPFDSIWDVGPSFHTDVVRPHALGRFEDLLLAAMRHPGMLRYLSNDVSNGAMVNENLGRELLELHTVGISGGYTEKDVRNSAYVLSGRTIADDGTFTFVPALHYVGPVSVMGWSSANATAAGGLAVGENYLKYLANQPATARTISRKLAVRFVSDAPSDDLVNRLAAIYLSSGTNISAVLTALFSTTDFWSAIGTKALRPRQDLIAGLRALDVAPGPDLYAAVQTMQWRLTQQGDAPLAWPAPNGYPDVTAAWNNAGGLLARWNQHRHILSGAGSGLSMTAADALIARPAATSGAYLDQLTTALTGQRFAAPHRAALLQFCRVTDATPRPVVGGLFGAGLIALILDSPYFQLR